MVTAGVRRPSSTRLLADRLTEAVTKRLGEVDVTVVEVRDHAHDLVNHMISGFPSDTLAPAMAAVTGAAGLIAVTPVVSASYSALFKAFFDVLDQDALRDKPVLAAATGGTARHSLVLDHAVRPLFAYLYAEVVPTTVFAAPEDWGGATAPARLADRVGQAAEELAVRMTRQGDPPPRDPYAPIPFDTLLPGG